MRQKPYPGVPLTGGKEETVRVKGLRILADQSWQDAFQGPEILSPSPNPTEFRELKLG